MAKLLNGRYLLRKELARGGMSTVYDAIDVSCDDTPKVAVKILNADKDLRRFNSLSYDREVEAYSRLSHKNVLRIFDHGVEQDETRYIVLEWMPIDLEAYRDEAPRCFTDWPTFSRSIGIPVLEALAHCHSNQIAHRDVKPANILISEDGIPRLADFGLSKLRHLLQPRRTLATFGSPPFTPPESDDGSYTYSRDVYAFVAVCLWAFGKDVLENHADLVKALDTLDIDHGVKSELARCIDKDPARRPETASILLERLVSHQTRDDRLNEEQTLPRSPIRLSEQAAMHLRGLLGYDSATPDSKLRRFLLTDINDSPTLTRKIRNYGKANQEVVPDQFEVWGASFRYNIVPSNEKAFHNTPFVVVAVDDMHDRLMNVRRDHSMPAGLKFTLDSSGNRVDAHEMAGLINGWLDEFEAEERRTAFENRRHEKYDLWDNLLKAHAQWEIERFGEITYDIIYQKGNLIRLETSLEDVALPLDSIWLLPAAESRVKCRLIEQNGSVLMVSTNRRVAADANGRMERSRWEFDSVLSRQRNALNSLSNGNAVSPKLAEVILDPVSIKSPKSNEGKTSFDRALNGCLTSESLFLVTGPPGAGKTTLIKEVVSCSLRANQDYRILVCAQTNVAIDNAIERIVEDTDVTPVRIAGNKNSVSQQVQEFIVDQQLESWVRGIEEFTTSWRRFRAEQAGVDIREIELGSLLLQLSMTRAEQSRVVSKLENVRPEVRRLRSESKLQIGNSGRDDTDRELANLESEQERSENRLAGLREEVKRHEAKLRDYATTADTEFFVNMKPDEINEWAHELLGDSEEAKEAFHLLTLQSEWLERLSQRDDSLYPALCDSASVVAATCIGLESLPGASELEFDLCILDEASKANPTESLVPMVRSHRWVLVGDVNQLPPYEDDFLLQSDIRERFNIPHEYRPHSLFEELLADVPAECTETLDIQYRMLPAIGELVSDVFYSGILRSAERSPIEALQAFMPKPVTWFSTSSSSKCTETKVNRSYVNDREKDAIITLVEQINNAVKEFSRQTIARFDGQLTVLILSGYVAQVNMIDRELRRINLASEVDVRVATVDAVQGRQAHVVIFSLTRSNPQRNAGFLKDQKRINVALSRAQELLCIFGDHEFVEQQPEERPLTKVLRYIRQQSDTCGIVDLESNQE
ncbi:MAG: AAA domain-containing protein [Fuerstiella sp.]